MTNILLIILAVYVIVVTIYNNWRLNKIRKVLNEVIEVANLHTKTLEEVEEAVDFHTEVLEEEAAAKGF